VSERGGLLKRNSVACQEKDWFSVHSAVPFNQPKLCPNATWNPNAITFATNSTVGSSPRSIFIINNNTIIVPSQTNGQILIWSNGSSNPPSIIRANLLSPWNVFVTIDDQILTDNNLPSSRIDRWTLNGTLLDSPMSICSGCAGLFVDINSDLYCSQYTRHQVLKKSLNDQNKAIVIAAGTGCNGSSSYMLSLPNGIFVTENLDLYVADWENNRVQLFRSGELNGTTVAGATVAGTITLYHPISIILDADGYLFILDGGNSRVVRSGLYGFRCLVGCSGSSGASSDQLFWPEAMSFDIDGNLFVTDTYNHRIQKFMLSNNNCGE
jgi:hypothetical protein